jgi:hypothetical protein
MLVGQSTLMMELRSGYAKFLIITKMQWSSRPRVSWRLGGAERGEIQCRSTRIYPAVICSLAPPAH